MIAFLLLGAVMGSGLGMTLGTLVQPSQISIVFALVLTPLLFTGCTQYPWPSLSSLRWFQVLTLVNPLRVSVMLLYVGTRWSHRPSK
jgi:ABC-2 type transport system permease protein